MRIARPGVNLLVHGKSASAFVAWNKADAESNPSCGGGIQENWRLAFGLPFVGGWDPEKLEASFRPTLRGGGDPEKLEADTYIYI